MRLVTYQQARRGGRSPMAVFAAGVVAGLCGCRVGLRCVATCGERQIGEDK